MVEWKSNSSHQVAYRRGRNSIREAYEEHFLAMDAREVTIHRVVNIVDKRSPMPQPGLEHDRGFNDDQWYGGPRSYQDTRECHGDGSYPPSERRYFDENPHYGNFRRNSPPPRNEGPYSQHGYAREDLRHHLGSRNRGRPGPYIRNRGRGSGPPLREGRDNYRISPPVAAKRDRSPGSRDAQPSTRSGSNANSKSFSPDRDKGHTHHSSQKKHKPSVHTPSSSVEEPPHSSGSSKEKTPASVAETEEVAAASVEPKVTPEDDFKASRLEAIKAKALEIEKDYRRDCETFRTVVKMLVAKEPSLDDLLQAPLDKNLLEIKQRCLDALRHFVKELDEVTQGGDGPDCSSPDTSSTTHVQKGKDFPQVCPTNPTDTDRKQEERKQPGNTGHSTPALDGTEGREKQTGNTEDSTPVQAGNEGGGGKQTGNIKDSSTPVPAGNQDGGKQTGTIEDSIRVTEIYKPGRRENLAILGSEDGDSPPMELPSESPLPRAHQGPVESHTKRLQLYSRNGEKFSNTHLSSPKVWQDIAYIRPGWVPDHVPFLKPGRYWELRANSTVVSAGTRPYGKGQKERVACVVTCYSHAEGPWCEVQDQNGTRICILAAPPPTNWIPSSIGQESLEQNAREGFRRGPRPY